MADQGFEPYHVPQQSRRDKLRFLPGQPNPVNNNLHSLFDPTSSPEFLTSAGSSSSSVKEEHHNLMSYINNNHNPSSFRAPPQPYLDHHHHPQPSNNFHDINIMTNLNNSFHYEQQGLFRLPEPLSLSLSSNPSDIHHYPSSYGYSGMTSEVGPSPVGPFTGYASVLKGSRFLKPAQQLLEDLCDVGSSSREDVSRVTTAADESSSVLDDAPIIEGLEDPAGDDVGGESRRRSCLISMLDEVC